MTGRSDTVLVGVDGSGGSAEAVGWAARFAAGRGLGLEVLHCLQVASLYYGGGFAGSEVLFGDLQREGDRVVAEARDRVLEVDPALRVRTEVCTDSAAAVLIERSRGARVVVLGCTGRGGFAGMLVGGTAATVAGHACCPV
ncbi:universal stress protein, partial [Amycolatopsis panacis]